MRKIGIILVLLMCGVAWGVAEPVYEYGDGAYSTQSAATTSQASNADGGITNTAAYAVRTAAVISASITIPTISSTQCTPVSIYNGYVYCIDDTKLMKTANYTNFTTIIDISQAGSILYDWYHSQSNGTVLQYAVVASDGAMYVAIGSIDAAVDGVASLGKLFKSSDGGSTWSEILHFHGGCPAYFEVSGSVITAGEYNAVARYTVDTGVAVYYSEDAGATFHNIFSLNSAGNFHIHNATVVSRGGVTEALVSVGDSGTSIYHIKKPANWTSGPWEPVTTVNATGEITATGAPTEILYDASTDSITCGGLEGLVGRIYLSDYTRDVLFHNYVPSGYGYGETNKSSAYQLLGNGTNYQWCHGINKIDGVWYAGILHYGLEQSGNTGLYASIDGYAWTCLWRAPTAGYVRNIVGLHGNYIIAQYGSTTSTRYLVAFPKPTVKNINTFVIAKGYQNKFGISNSNETTFGAWPSALYFAAGAGDQYTISRSTTVGLHGTDSMRIVPVYSKNISDASIVRSGWLNDFLPGDGQFVTMTLHAKVDSPVPLAWSIRPMCRGTTNRNIGNLTPLSKNWQKVTSTMYCATSGSVNDQQGFAIYCPSYASLTQAQIEATSIYVDCVSFRYETERYLSESEQFHASGTAANDYKYAAATSSINYTITGEWYPREGMLDFPAVDTVTTLPIVTGVFSDGGYVEFRWNRTDQKFELSDGSTTVALTPATIAAIEWRHWDCIKFAICSNGTNPVVYMYAPTNNFNETDADGILTFTATGVAGSKLLSSLRLGANAAGTNIGCGFIGNVRVFDSKLSASDVATVFNTVAPMRAGIPAVTDVRDGVSFDGANVGTLVLPAENKVEKDIQYGAGGTEFTGTSSTYTRASVPKFRPVSKSYYTKDN